MGTKRTTTKHRTAEAEGDETEAELLEAVDLQLDLMSELRDYGVKLADANPESPNASAFRDEMRKAKSALADARSNLRILLGVTHAKVREGAERETRAHADAMRPALAGKE